LPLKFSSPYQHHAHLKWKGEASFRYFLSHSFPFGTLNQTKVRGKLKARKALTMKYVWQGSTIFIQYLCPCISCVGERETQSLSFSHFLHTRPFHTVLPGSLRSRTHKGNWRPKSDSNAIPRGPRNSSSRQVNNPLVSRVALHSRCLVSYISKSPNDMFVLFRWHECSMKPLTLFLCGKLGRSQVNMTKATQATPEGTKFIGSGKNCT